jgi:hypothetical protein
MLLTDKGATAARQNKNIGGYGSRLALRLAGTTSNLEIRSPYFVNNAKAPFQSSGGGFF